MSGLGDPRITRRDVGVTGDATELDELEARLEAFVAEVESANIDESDEHGSTRELSLIHI